MSSSGHGGRREGAGRPPDSHNVLGKKAREQAARAGLLPHEILLDMARGNPQKEIVVKEAGPDKDGFPALVVEERWVTVTVEQQRDAAKAAAPYYAPKLSNVELARSLNDDEVDELIRQLAAQAGLASVAGGEGQEAEAAERPARQETAERGRRRLDL